MRSLGAKVELIDVGNYDHVTGFFQSLPMIKKWFDSFFFNSAPFNLLLIGKLGIKGLTLFFEA